MAACELIRVAVAALMNVGVFSAPVAGVAEPSPELLKPDVPVNISDRPLFQRSDSAAPVNAPAPPRREQEPVRTAPLPPSALMGIGIIGGLMLTAALRRRKS